MPDAESGQDKKPMTLQDGISTDDYVRWHEFWRSHVVCPECGWNIGYHDDGCCPTPEQQAVLRGTANGG